MTIGILGSGFGLYGYLPALSKLGEQVAVLSKAKPIIEAREELKEFSNKISYFDNEADLLIASNSIVHARTPDLQRDFILQYAGKFDHLYLEKPLSPDVRQDQKLLDHLSNLDQSFSIGYLFLFTEWFQDLELGMVSSTISEIEITWGQIFSNDWKSNISLGGGILKYYGIHYLSILAKLRDLLDEITYRITDTEFTIFCKSKSGVTLKLKLTSTDIPGFKISYDSKIRLFEKSPFKTKQAKVGSDPRVHYIEKYLKHSSTADSTFSLRIENSILSMLRQIEFGSSEASRLHI